MEKDHHEEQKLGPCHNWVVLLLLLSYMSFLYLEY